MERRNGRRVDDPEDVYFERLVPSSYNTLKDYWDKVQSSAIIEGAQITDAGGGQINVATAKGIIKKTNSDIGENTYIDIPAATALGLTDNATNWVYADYNSGSPQFAVTTNFASIDHHTKIVVGKVYREGATVNIMRMGVFFSDYMVKECLHAFYTEGIVRAFGLEFSETGTRNLAMTAGRLYCSVSYFDVSAFDSSGTDRFNYYYRDGVGGWTVTTGNSQIDNVNYDANNPAGPQPLTANRYGVFWVYVSQDGDVDVVYGQGDYTITQAQNATPPTALPAKLTDFDYLAAKIIIQKNAATFTDLQSAWVVPFAKGVGNDHNDLSGLQGGAAGQYYHLSNSQYTALGTPQTSGIGHPAQTVNGNATRGTNTTYDGGMFYAKNPISFNRVAIRLTGVTGDGATYPIFRVLIFQASGGICDTSAASLIATCSVIPNGAGEYEMTPSEGTVNLEKGYYFVLFGKDNVAGGSCTAQVYGTQAVSLLNTNGIGGGVYAASAFTTSEAVDSTPPAVLDPTIGGGTVTETTNNVVLVHRFRTV